MSTMKHIIILLSWCWMFLVSAVTQEIRRDNLRLLQDDIVFDILMPDVQVLSYDQYLCMAMKIDTDQAFITRFEPHAKASRAHHMLLFSSPTSPQLMYPQYWDCSHGKFGGMKILFAWAKNAPPVKLPEDVGFQVGQNTDARYLVLQVHYAKNLKDGETDNSGFRLLLKKERQKYLAGIFLLSNSGSVIPPALPRVHVDVSCNPTIHQPIYVFAYRVHTHELGYAVSGYKFNTQNSSWSMMLKGNPKWPQAIYPTSTVYKVTPDDIVVARCSYDSSPRSTPTRMGRGSKDEMCNLYLMYYMEENDSETQTSVPRGCRGNFFPKLVWQLPESSDDPLPPNPQLEEQAANDEIPQSVSQLTLPDINISKKGHAQLMPDEGLSADYDDTPKPPPFDDSFQYKEVVGWPVGNLSLGQVTAVSIDKQGNVVIFHRGSHVWNGLTFDYNDNYLLQDDGPIPEDTIIVFDPSTGHVLRKWGRDMFFMPHGLTIDSKGYAWLTDVALHQILKYPENGSATAELIIGERFKPGYDRYHFCKPTSVAIASSGEFYVADGYCNSRIVKYSSEGKYMSQWGRANPLFQGNPVPPPGAFLIPHKVLLASEENLVCVADRENGRIQCFFRRDHSFAFAIQRDEFHGKMFSVAATPEKDGVLYAVCGRSATGFNHSVSAFVFNLTTQALLNIVTPRQGTFAQPHDLAVSPDTETMYVGEIGPNIIWKFRRAVHKSSKKVLPAGQGEVVEHSGEGPSSLDGQAHSGPQATSQAPKTSSKEGVLSNSNAASASQEASSLKDEKKAAASEVITEASNFVTSMVIMALLGIPILLLVLITVIVRLRKRGRFQQCSFPQVKGWLGGYRTPHGSHEKFNIGSLLNPHKGFDRVALDESDLDVEDKSDSEVEEFNAASTRKA